PNVWQSNGEFGYVFAADNGVEDVVVDHNTMFRVSGGGMQAYEPLGAVAGVAIGSYYTVANRITPANPVPPNEGITITNNIIVTSGISEAWEPLNDGSGNAGTTMLNLGIVPSSYTVTGNGFVKTGAHVAYPAGNNWLTSESAVSFSGSTCSGASCRVNAGAPWHGAATDGTD